MKLKSKRKFELIIEQCFLAATDDPFLSNARLPVEMFSFKVLFSAIRGKQSFLNYEMNETSMVVKAVGSVKCTEVFRGKNTNAVITFKLRLDSETCPPR